MAKVQTYSELIDELTYSSYKYNRDLTPTTTPEQWKMIFGSKTEALEARYQSERTIELTGQEPDEIRAKVYCDLDKVSFARFGKPYNDCDFEQCCQVVDENCRHIQFALTENAILLKKLQFNMNKA